MNVSVSVVVPVYNVEEYLRDCLDSLVNQTVSFDEIIVVNDGSTDASYSICREYSEMYNNIILIDQVNQGLSMARNAGMLIAKSDYVVFVDSDDYMALDAVEKLKRMLQKCDVDILYYAADITKKDKPEKTLLERYERDTKLCMKQMNGMDFFIESFPHNHIVTAWVAAYKLSFLRAKKIVFPAGLYFEDVPFYLMTSLAAESVYSISDKLYVWRCREESITNSEWSEKKSKDIIKVYTKCWQYLLDTFNDYILMKNFREYFAFGMISIWENIEDVSHYNLVNEMEELLDLYFKIDWKDRKEYSIMEICALMVTDYFLEKYPQLILRYYKDAENYQKHKKDMRWLICNSIKSWLARIPFERAEAIVGIYGIGNHTKYLLEYYKKYVGEIKSSLFFLVSDDKNTGIYEGNRVVLYTSVKPENAFYVLSSMVYQKDMEENLLRTGIEKERIIKLYDKTIWRDLYQIDRMIKFFHE